MSGLNHKGPMNQGPMTGRKMGKCTNFGAGRNTKNETTDSEETNSINQDFGYGFGRGLSIGFGCRGMGGRGMGQMNRNRFRFGR